MNQNPDEEVSEKNVEDSSYLEAKLLEVATKENAAFGISATWIYDFLSSYEQGAPIPGGFWDAYTRLSDAVPHDGTGKLQFDETQAVCMEIITDLLRVKNLLVHLPSRAELMEQFSKAAEEYGFKPFLEKHYLPILLSQQGRELEIHEFLHLLLTARTEIIRELTASQSPDIAFGTIVVDMFPHSLISAMVRNPQLAEYAGSFLRSIQNTRAN